MRKGNLLFSAVHFFHLIAIVCIAIFFLCLEYVPSVQSGTVAFFSNSHPEFKWIGYLLLGLSGSLFLGLYAMNRSQYLTIEMGERVSASLGEEIVKETIEKFWLARFPDLPAPQDVYVSKKKINVVAPMPGGEEKTLKEIEKELSVLLDAQLGYRRSFSLLLTLK